MNFRFLVPCLGLAACLSGCFTVETAKVASTGAEHVVMNNWGWKLFDWIPLFSGNADEGASTSCVLFRDDVTFEKIQKRFERYANGREIECPVWTPVDCQVITVWYIPIPYLLTYKEYTLSGTLK